MCSESKSSSPSHWKINRKVQIGLGDHNDFVHLMNFGMMESVTFRITNPNLWHFNRTLWHLCFYMPWVAVKMGQPKAALLKKGTKSHTKHTADEMPHGHHPEDRMKKGKKTPFSHIWSPWLSKILDPTCAAARASEKATKGPCLSWKKNCSGLLDSSRSTATAHQNLCHIAQDANAWATAFGL